MKKRNLSKKLLAITLGMLFALSLTACVKKNEGESSQKNSSNKSTDNKASLSGTPSTLLNSKERRLWYRTINKVAKDTGADLYVFENGTVTHYNTNLEIKLGDLEGKNDDEIIAIYKGAAKDINTIDSFSLHVYTDSTGNNTEYEKLDIPFAESQLHITFHNAPKTAYQIYSAEYAGFIETWSEELHDSFLTRVDGAFDLSLDQPGADGVEID